MEEIIITKASHEGENIFCIQYNPNANFDKVCETMECIWNRINSYWTLKNNKENLKLIYASFRGIAYVNARAVFNKDQPKILKVNRLQEDSYPIPTEYKAMLIRRRYSKNTYVTYTSMFQDFLNFLKGQDLETVTDDDIKEYQDYLVTKRKVAISTQNQAINAIKFYFEKVKGGERKTYYIERPRKEYKLPKTLSKEDIFKMIETCTFIKHRVIIGLLYSAGLRRNELLQLKITDVDLDQNLIYIRNGKGKKDRITLLAEKIKSDLIAYLQEEKPVHWLIESPSRTQYSGTSVGNIVKNAAKKAQINKTVTPHMLRHSFATHLLEQGVDIRYIQELLGHTSTETTMIYTHVSKSDFAKIKSPFDNFKNIKDSDNSNSEGF